MEEALPRPRLLAADQKFGHGLGILRGAPSAPSDWPSGWGPKPSTTGHSAPRTRAVVTIYRRWLTAGYDFCSFSG